MKSYVAGLMFRNDGAEVALIRKDHPAWQAGKLNAIGGKMDSGESASDAMAREFKEETGYETKRDHWRMFCRLHGEDWEVFFFVHHSPHADAQIRQMETEVPGWFPVERLEAIGDLAYIHGVALIPNLRWLIPLALDKDQVTAIVADYSTFGQ